jgi:hypothetical protein
MRGFIDSPGFVLQAPEDTLHEKEEYADLETDN